MTSFRAQISLKRLRMCENKSYHSVSFLPDLKYTKFQKNRKKIQNIKQYRYGYISSQNRMEKDVKERKQKLSFHSVPIRRRIKNSKTNS